MLLALATLHCRIPNMQAPKTPQAPTPDPGAKNQKLSHEDFLKQQDSSVEAASQTVEPCRASQSLHANLGFYCKAALRMEYDLSGT